MKTKKIELIAAPPEHHWVGDGFRVHNFIPGVPGAEMERMNPFVLLDYNARYRFAPSEKPRGVGVHPHRGFETVSIAYKGRIAHHDSNGGGGVIGEGDAQWMTAAGGILHKEYHEKEWSRRGGDFHMVQLWVNLPARDKLSPPKYQAVTNAMMGRALLPGGGAVEVLAGKYGEAVGPASTFTPMHVMNAKLKKGGKAEFSFPAAYNTALLAVEGDLKVNGRAVPADSFVLFANEGEDFTVEAESASIALVLSGEPLNEPVASYGPFVMNTRKEIKQAVDDFNAGKFGHLDD